MRLGNLLANIPQRLEHEKRNLETLNHQVNESREELKKTFPQEQSLAEKQEKLNRLTLELNRDNSKQNQHEEVQASPSKPMPLSSRIAKVQDAEEGKSRRQEAKDESREFLP
jgi:predicted RNase H-like nuclease (RuvC/YqgF family)